MDKQLADDFFAQASKTFAFVVTDHAFAAPLLEVDDQINFAFVTFMGKNLALECHLDEREGDVACVIARVTGARKSTYRDAVDERDEQGVRVREHLNKLVERRGVRERLFTPIGTEELRERIRITLGDFARMLRKHGQEVLSDSPDALHTGAESDTGDSCHGEPLQLLELHQRASSLRNAGHTRDAARVLGELLALQPDWEHGGGWYQEAGWYEELGEIEKARHAYQEALKYAPRDSYYLGGYAAFEYLHGDARHARPIDDPPA